MMARLAPRTLSKVRTIRSSRAWVSTWMVTSSGIASLSIRWRTKSKSVCDAEGKATSISLKPIATSVSNMRRLRSPFIGSISAWLPSRRSELHQIGGDDDGARRPGAIGKLHRREGVDTWWTDLSAWRSRTFSGLTWSDSPSAPIDQRKAGHRLGPRVQLEMWGEECARYARSSRPGPSRAPVNTV